jgi:hypothetical protein
MPRIRDLNFAALERGHRDLFDVAAGRAPYYLFDARSYWGQDVDPLHATLGTIAIELDLRAAVGPLYPESLDLDSAVGRTLRRVRSHPRWRAPSGIRSDTWPAEFEAWHRRAPLPWDLRAALDELLVDFLAAHGDQDISYGCGYHDLEYYFSPRFGPIERLVANDVLGAFSPTFRRGEALRGGWWLIQPVSPRVVPDALCRQLGLRLVGYLPLSHVDAPGRFVLACQNVESVMPRGRDAWIHEEAQILRRIHDNRFVAGHSHISWSTDAPPLSDPTFDLDFVPHPVPPDGPGYGPYRHSSDLPPYPPPRGW